MEATNGNSTNMWTGGEMRRGEDVDDELALVMLNRTIPMPNPSVPSHVARHRPIPSRPRHVPSSQCQTLFIKCILCRGGCRRPALSESLAKSKQHTHP